MCIKKSEIGVSRVVLGVKVSGLAETVTDDKGDKGDHPMTME
jgi:hypothetical protein